MKRLFKILIWVVIALVILILLAPYLFKDKIISTVKEEINNSVNAEVDFKDADVSLIRSFPSISIELNELSVDGVDEFEGIPLMNAKEIFFATDWKSVIKSGEGITISKIYVDEPYLNILVNDKGDANYDIAKPSDDKSTSDKSFFGSIESYEIENGTVIYVDDTAELKAEILGLNHKGTGNFQDVIFDLDSETSIEELNVQQSGIKYLKKAKADAEIVLGIDLDKQKYSFKENVMHLNDLAFSFVGDVALIEEGFDIDLDLNAANNTVSSILSLIPNVYTADYSNVKSSGIGSLTGSVKGVYDSIKEVYPKINLKINLDKGEIQYPDLPIPIKDIFLDMLIQSNQADLSDLSINVPEYRFLLDEDRVSGRLSVTNALGDPHIVGATQGKLNLAKIAKAYPFEDMTLMSGIVDGDISIDARQSDIESQNYNNIKLSGQAVASDINMDYIKDMPVKIDRMEAQFSPKTVDIKVDQSSIGRSDFSGITQISDPLQFIVGDSQPVTNIDIRSKTLDVDQLMALSETSEETAIDTTAALDIPFDNYIVNANYTADNIIYEDYDIKNLIFEGRYDSDKLSIKQSSMDLDKSPINMRGTLVNVMAYTIDNEKLTGDLFLNASKLNSNKYINESEEAEAILEPVIVPGNVELDIYPEIKTLIYDTYTLSNIDGKISIANGIAQLLDGSAELFNGKINFDGAYNSTDVSNPLFDFKYDISQMNFSQYFEKSESFKLLAPFAKYIDGIFNSTLVISGPLTKEMMPDLYKIDASGFMETVEGKINGFKPLEVLGGALGIDEVKNWDIKDSKNWFEITEGNIILKPHDYEVKDMLFTVGGKHSIDQKLDYVIKAKIPRERLSKAQLGKTLEMGMSEIEKQAQSRGVNINLGDFVHLDVFITGSVTNPKVKILPVGSGGKTLTDVAKNAFNEQKEILKDTLTKEINKRTEEVKDTITKVIQKKTDTLRSKVQSELDKKTEEAKQKLKDKAKEKLDSTVAGTIADSLSNAAKDKLGDVLGNGGSSEVDSIKSKIKDWNPFKKKKKN